MATPPSCVALATAVVTAWALVALGCTTPRDELEPLAPVDAAAAPAMPGDAAVAPPRPDASNDRAADLCTGVRCEAPLNATATCQPATGRCGGPVCNKGWGDCDGQPGCETRVDSTSRCGGCTTACGIGFDCGPDYKCTCGAAFMVCGDQCVDVGVNGRHCGRCFADCPGACIDGVCQCVPPRMGNAVLNAGFDTSASGWTAAADDLVELAWHPRDAASACPGAQGSMVIRNRKGAPNRAVVSQCVALTPVDPMISFSWAVGASFYFPSPVGGTASLRLIWYSAAGCSAGSLIRDDVPLELNSPGPDRWGLLSQYVSQVPPDARSATIQILVDKQVSGGVHEVWLDRVHLTTGGAF